VRVFKSTVDKEAVAADEAEYGRLLSKLATSSPSEARAIAKQLEKPEAFVALPDKRRRNLGHDALLQYATAALADDHLTEDEEDALAAVAEAVGFTQADFQRTGVYTQLQVAKLNDGRLPVVGAPVLMAKRGEVVHLETPAALLKEVSVREWRAGSQGVSFRVAKGVRYRVGSTRGRLVTVGTQIQTADSGTLSVTNQRVVFLGNRKTIDMPYTKLLGMHLYSDAVSFSLSNRQDAPLIQVSGVDVDVLGALLNATVQASGSDEHDKA
jgi:hypothetical protein